MGRFASLVGKDIALQWRRRDALLLVFLFALLVLLIFAFAYGPIFAPPELTPASRRREIAKLASGVFWIAVAFAGVITLSRGAEIDRRDGAVKAIRLAGVEPLTFYFSRIVSIWLLLSLVEMAMLPLTVAFLQVDHLTFQDVGRLAGIAALGTLGFSAMGAFLSSIMERESFLTALLFPLLIPLFIAATKCSVPLFASEPFQETRWLGLLVAYPLLTMGVCSLLAESLLEE